MLTAGTKLYDEDLFIWFDASQQPTGSDATFRTHDLKPLGATTQTAVCSSSFTITDGVGLRNVGAIDLDVERRHFEHQWLKSRKNQSLAQ